MNLLYIVFISGILGLVIVQNTLIERTSNTVSKKIIGNKNDITLESTQIHKYYQGTKAENTKPFVEKELVTKALLRTCTKLYVEVLYKNCTTNPKNPSLVWGFVGNIGTTGNLSNAWSGSTSTTFSCANIDAHGRYLLQRAIPKSFIDARNFRYDFRGMTNTGDRTYPCGYSDIVYQ